MKKAWIIRRAEGKTFTPGQHQKGAETRRKNLPKHDFVHSSGITEYHISAFDLSQKYPDQKLTVSRLNSSIGCNTKGYRMHKGWRIFTNDIVNPLPRSLDKRTSRKLLQITNEKFDTWEEVGLSLGIDKMYLKNINTPVSSVSLPVPCPHCGLVGRGGAMKKYHFDRCKKATL